MVFFASHVHSHSLCLLHVMLAALRTPLALLPRSDCIKMCKGHAIDVESRILKGRLHPKIIPSVPCLLKRIEMSVPALVLV